MVPACLAKSRLTMPGSNTPITPMLAPASTLPATRPISPKELRRMIPPASVRRMPNTTRSAPKRRASTGASGPNNPRNSPGNVVSKPAWAADRPRLFDTSLSSGAMLDSAGRRFKATRIRPSSNNHGCRRTGWVCWTCSSSASAAISSSSSSAVRLGEVTSVCWLDMAFSVSRFIDQLPRQGFGPLRVALLHGIKQFDVQVEHLLAPGRDVQAVAQLFADNAGEIAIQLTERRVVRGVHQASVEHKVTGDVGVEIAVIVGTADAQCLAQGHQVFIGAAHGGQADGLDFKDVPCLPGLFE